MTNYAKGTGNTPLIIFRGGAQRTTEIVYAPASNYTNAADDVYDFVSKGADAEAQNYVNESGSYSHSTLPPPAPPANAPDPMGFIAALRAEPSFTPQIRIGLANLFHAKAEDLCNKTTLSQDWQDMIALFGNDWLTASVQQTIISKAKKFNIPLA
jgi:hypothetical protein